MCGVAFLPHDLGGTQKWTRTHFPAHDVCPLIDQYGQISVRVDPSSIHVPDNGFRGGANHEWLIELGCGIRFYFWLAIFTDDRSQSVVGNQRTFFGKALDMFCFFTEKGLRNQQRKIRVDVIRFFKATIQIGFDVFPDGKTIGSENHAPTYWRRVNEFAIGDDFLTTLNN